MKYLALFLLASLVNYSCNSGGPVVKIGATDTVLVIANEVGNYKFMDSAIRTGVHGFTPPTDSSSTGKWGAIYRFRLGQRNDTVRDATGKPLLDAAHNPIVHFTYAQVPVADSLTKYIEVVNLPNHPLNLNQLPAKPDTTKH